LKSQNQIHRLLNDAWLRALALIFSDFDNPKNSKILKTVGQNIFMLSYSKNDSNPWRQRELIVSIWNEPWTINLKWSVCLKQLLPDKYVYQMWTDAEVNFENLRLASNKNINLLYGNYFINE
jgi:hypothetical protein